MQLLVGPHNRKFSAHEDVLCSRSPYFKKRFQQVRKPVTGECEVCLDELLEVVDAVFCRICGQNFHAQCMDQWLHGKHDCPACRTAWNKLPAVNTSAFDQLDPDGFEVYVQWLYSQQIPSYKADEARGARCVRLLKAHLVGDTLEDTEFIHAVRNDIVESAMEGGLSYDTIDFAYQHTHKPCALRRFLVDLYALTGDARSLKEGNVSKLFLIDMAQSFMNKSKPEVEGENIWTMLAGEGHIPGHAASWKGNIDGDDEEKTA